MARALRRGGLLAAVALSLILGSAGWQPVLAATPAQSPADSIIHVVHPGETLYLIGLQYGISWTAIMQANQLPSTTIYSGQQLIIPGVQAAGTTAPLPAPAATAASPAPAAVPANAASYVVQPGDTLAFIASEYAVDLNTLAAANNISDPSLIYTGQLLTIPGPANAPQTAPAPGKVPGEQKLIEVSLSKQQMTVYQDGGVLWQWVVSTGEPGLDTLPGNYSVLDKIPDAYAANWDLWMPNWLGIYWAGPLENGIHALPILPDGLRLWDGYLGQRVSFGCVILGIQEAQTLYDWADVGTPVDIQQ